MKDVKSKIVLFVLFAFASFMVSRLYYIQIQRGDYFEALALGQQLSFEEISGERGGIFFLDNNPLAQSKEKYLVYVFPKKVSPDSLDDKINWLSETLKENKETLKKIFEKGNVFKKEIDRETANKLNRAHFKGVYVDKFWGRIYPQRELASHVIGFLNEQGKGQYGLEGYYDDILKGEKSLTKRPRSPLGYLTVFFQSSQSERDKELEGANLFVTLDYNIQYFSEKLLSEAKEKWDIDAGQIVVAEPSTGKILALASFPNFDPNNYSKYKNLEIFTNPAVQALFEPGSVFKPITFAGALEEGLITPETTYVDKGYVKLGGPPIYNFQRRVWGEQKMTDVLEESINTGAVFVQQKLGEKKFLDYVKKFGFFEKTGIDLQGEVFSNNEALKRGYKRDIATASFGQGIQVTPIQIVAAFSAIANGGKLMRPYIVDKIIRNDGEVFQVKPEIKRRVISEKTSATLTSMLISVVEHGSARRAKIPGYFIAGKTGTAQVPLRNRRGYSKTATIQSFVGFFPALEPRVLVFVKLDNPKGVKISAYSAVPLAKKLIKYIIDYLQIPPSGSE
jgi:cell division protein FtsI/penicillin-binding protein 2